MLEGAKLIRARAAIIASAGAAIGIGNVLSSLIHSVARNPSLAKQSFGYAILGFALTEAITSFASMMAFLISSIFRSKNQRKKKNGDKEEMIQIQEKKSRIVSQVRRKEASPENASRLDRSDSDAAVAPRRYGLDPLLPTPRHHSMSGIRGDILDVTTPLVGGCAAPPFDQYTIGSHTWSPDAMEGPTPVSALIHAATMVTAGVFMIARCSPLFEYPPTALIVITFAGAMTSFLAATTGILQNDLKRVIAYSTCSQLGYMIFACGISNYSISVFHLMNHAFFKALLFLSVGPTNSFGQDILQGHDAPIPMAIPLILLALKSLFVGHNSPNTIIWGEQELGIRCGRNSRQWLRCSVDSLPLCGVQTPTSEQKREEERGPGEPS
nr:NADH dehydrogenase subunit 5, mitochondrial [Tanacetum cinerariifolium]